MGFTAADLFNLLSLFASLAGTFIMFFYSPVVNSQKYLYRKSEMPAIIKRDAYKNKMIRRGLFLILMACLLQAIAIFLNVAFK